MENLHFSCTKDWMNNIFNLYINESFFYWSLKGYYIITFYAFEIWNRNFRWCLYFVSKVSCNINRKWITILNLNIIYKETNSLNFNIISQQKIILTNRFQIRKKWKTFSRRLSGCKPKTEFLKVKIKLLFLLVNMSSKVNTTFCLIRK